MKLAISQRALREARDIFLHIAVDDRFAAESVRNRIFEAFDYLAQYPYGAHATLVGNMRSMTVNPYPYVVLYRVVRKHKEVRTLSVMHGARRRPALREEATEFRAQPAS